MARQVPANPSRNLGDAAHMYSQEVQLNFKPKWYFTEEEIEEHSPSRSDGIDCEHESRLRELYCTYLQKLGMELKLPQLTIATAMMLCHRFYMYQSHAKNHWQMVANSSMFLASKAEDTPCCLKDLIAVCYRLMYVWDPLAPQKIRQKDVYEKQKQLALLGEQLILVTVAFDLNIEHPYKPLVAALKKLEISQKELVKVAWNFVNDWLRTTLCLQYKPHYIAAGSVYLATKLQKMKLPSSNGKAWWMQFDVSPKLLEEVIQHMLRLLGKTNKQPLLVLNEVKAEQNAVAIKRKYVGSESHNLCGSTVAQDSSNYSMVTARVISTGAGNQKRPKSDDPQLNDSCPSDSGSANSIVEDGDADLIGWDSNQESRCKIVSVKEECRKIDVTKIRERLKRRKLDRAEKKKPDGNLEDEMSEEAWIEREIEKGIELVPALS